MLFITIAVGVALGALIIWLLRTTSPQFKIIQAFERREREKREARERAEREKQKQQE